MRITQNVCRWMTTTLTPALVFGLIGVVALATAASAQSVTIPAGVEKAAHAQITSGTLEAPIPLALGLNDWFLILKVQTGRIVWIERA